MLAEINPGTLINYRYQIQKVLGQGGFGRTYLATDTQRFGDLCVLKEFVPSNREEFFIQKSRELFEREARVLYQINHPQVPKFLAWFTDQERLFIVQEYIDGKTYSQLLQERLSQQNQSFSEAEVSQWIRDLLSVLDYLHGIKILHRDISLDNVMLPDNQSKPVLIDFGLVKEKVSQIWCVDSQGSRNSSPGTVLGRVGYAPPEQIRMGQSYPSSDLYALGVCAIVLLTGKMPDELMDQSLEWQWQSYVDISNSLAQILNKMLAEKPKQRYQSAKEILFELQPPKLPSEPDVSQPLKKVEINIDYANKERQVAEIVESDDFKLLEEQAHKFRRPEIATESDLEAHREEQTIPPEVNIITQPTEPGVVVPEFQSKTETPVTLNPEFITHCRKELVHYIGVMAIFLVNDILARSPQIAPQQLVEVLAAEIPHPQQVQAFKNSIESFWKSQTKTAITQQFTNFQKKISTHPVPLNPEFLDHCRQELTRFVGPFANFLVEDIIAQSPEITPEQLIEALVAEIPNPQRAQEFKNCIQISPLPPTVIELSVSSQQGNSTPPTDSSTQSYRMRARLIHVQTNRQIELPSHLSVIHIGKPNDRFTPEVDVSTFQNSEIVSRIHADIYVEANGFFIEDKGSVNGTCINNLPLLPITRYPLRTGDYISLGMQNLVKFMFQLF